MENKVIGIKSNQYIFAYCIAFILSTIVAIIMFIPVFKIKEFWPFLITSILFIIFDIILIALLIIFLRRPINLIEINDRNIILNRDKNTSITIPFSELVDSTISFTLFAIFVHNSGGIILKTKDNKKYKIGYIKDYIKISGQINSIIYIGRIGGNL